MDFCVVAAGCRHCRPSLSPLDVPPIATSIDTYIFGTVLLSILLLLSYCCDRTAEYALGYLPALLSSLLSSSPHGKSHEDILSIHCCAVEGINQYNNTIKRYNRSVYIFSRVAYPITGVWSQHSAQENSGTRKKIYIGKNNNNNNLCREKTSEENAQHYVPFLTGLSRLVLASSLFCTPDSPSRGLFRAVSPCLFGSCVLFASCVWVAQGGRWRRKKRRTP